jgi:hypothetical protein
MTHPLDVEGLAAQRAASPVGLAVDDAVRQDDVGYGRVDMQLRRTTVGALAVALGDLQPRCGGKPVEEPADHSPGLLDVLGVGRVQLVQPPREDEPLHLDPVGRDAHVRTEPGEVS